MNNREMNLVKEARREIKKIRARLPEGGRTTLPFFNGENNPKWTLGHVLHLDNVDDILKKLEKGKDRKGPPPPGQTKEEQGADGTR